jgi:hypothetical protein
MFYVVNKLLVHKINTQITQLSQLIALMWYMSIQFLVYSLLFFTLKFFDTHWKHIPNTPNHAYFSI